MLDLQQIKTFYEDHLRKGYTLEHINNYLLNHNYSPEVLKHAVDILEDRFVTISRNNPKKFDYEKLPEEIKELINGRKIQTPVQIKENLSGQTNINPDNPQNLPKIDIHPGLDKESLIKFGGIVLSILLVIIIFMVLMAQDNSDFNFSDNVNDIYDAYENDNQNQPEDIDNTPEEIPEEPEINNTQPEIDTNSTQTTENETVTQEEPEETPINQIIDTSNIVCSKNSDCNDNYVFTFDECDETKCKHRKATEKEYCGKSDGFCSEECYGYNDTDCTNSNGEKLCTEDWHCDDGLQSTEEFCVTDETYCYYTEVKNLAPEIYSEFNTTAFELQEWTYQVLANDTDGDELTFDIKGEPEGMEMNESGFVTWTPPQESRGEYTFDVEVQDIRDSDEKTDSQEVTVKVFMTAASDEFKIACGDSSTCYKDSAISIQDFDRCDYLNIYWEDPDYSMRNSCIFEIVKLTKNLDQCENIVNDEPLKDVCTNLQ